MTELSRQAERHLQELTKHYEKADRLEAARNLLVAVEAAQDRIARNPMAGAKAPRPYPVLGTFGLLWIYERPYWFAYKADGAPIIAGIFYERADIPGRV